MLIILSATNSRVSIISFTSIAGVPVGIESASLNFFSKNWNKILLSILYY